MPARTTHTCTNRHGRRVLIRPTGDKRVRFLIFHSDFSAQLITVQAQVNMPEVHLAGTSDQDLETYLKLLEELRELLPKDEPKRIGSGSR